MKNLKFKSKSIKKDELIEKYKIIIADDEEGIHSITKLVLKDFLFENKGVEFISAYSAKEAKEAIRDNPDTALILLDVVMEVDDAGFQVVKYIREELKNEFVRIVLRTGQPGQVPEEEIVVKYDINDYKEKTELTSTKLFTLFYSSLRSYRDIIKLKELNNEQSKILIQQSKMAEVGEMIGAIAHQWRQPLNTLALLIQDLEEAYGFGELNEEYMEDMVNNSIHQIDFMSKTIDDFRNFFKPNREKSLFSVREAIIDVYVMLSSQFKAHQIEVNISDNDFLVSGYANEFKQVVLNVLNNSKDAIIQRQIKESKLVGKVEINIEEKDKCREVSFLDNGGGIKEKVINKIFEPYFTTKAKSGTGVGLYMSKIIIERDMEGRVCVKNKKDGLKFNIKLPINS